MANLTTLSKVTPELVQRLAAELAEPEWLAKERRSALLTYQETPVPSTEEEWRRTDVSGLDPEAFRLGQLAGERRSEPAPEWLAYTQTLPGDDEEQPSPAPAGVLVVENGTLVYAQLDPELAQAGVFFGPLSEAGSCLTQLQPHWSRLVPHTYDKYAALTAAVATANLALYAPRHFASDRPFYVIHVTHGEAPADVSHLLVVADRTAEVSVVEVRAGSAGFSSGTVEVVPLDGARIRYAVMQNQDKAHVSIVTRRAETGRDAVVDWIGGEFGCRLLRSSYATELKGDGSESRLVTVYYGNGEQHLDLPGTMVHIGRNTTSDMTVKGALADHARSVIRGGLYIRFDAVNTASYERANTLLLSETARCDSIPSLYIDENDVKAGHAATAGQVNEEQLFYLRSRGLPEVEAKRLIVRGFLGELLGNIPLPAVRSHLAALVDRKMRHG